MRVQRDIIHLPMRYFPSPADNGGVRRTTLLPDREPYIMIRGKVRAQGTDDAVKAEGSAAGNSLLTSDGLAVSLPPDIRKIDIELPVRAARAEPALTGEVVAFGAYRREGETFIVSKPEDPMAEHVLVPGDPERISSLSRRVARVYTMVSAFFIVLNAVINIPLMFILLSFLIR